MDLISKKEFDDFVLTMASQVMSLRTEIENLKQQIEIKENEIKTN
jgi:regulator of replication initiation timing